MITKIEVSFLIPVNLTIDNQIKLDNLVKEICDNNTPEGYIFWPSSCGSKIIYMPMTAEEEKEKSIMFDNSIYSIDCSIRRK